MSILSRINSQIAAIKKRLDNIPTSVSSGDFTAHTSNTSNPHSVTKAQVGLGNVDNTADADKPISTATQTALDGKVNNDDTRLSDARTPLAHTHPVSQITDVESAYSDETSLTLDAASKHKILRRVNLTTGTAGTFSIANTVNGLEAHIIVENNTGAAYTVTLPTGDRKATSSVQPTQLLAIGEIYEYHVVQVGTQRRWNYQKGGGVI